MAQDLNGSFIPLPDGGGARGAVIGDAHGNNPRNRVDWYRFDVADGQSFTVVMTSHGDTPPFQLHDANGVTLLAQSVDHGGSQTIGSFQDSLDGNSASYLVRVDEPSSPYSVVVTRGAEFDVQVAGSSFPRIDTGHVLGYASAASDFIAVETEPNDDGVDGASVEDFALANDVSGSFSNIGANEYQAVITGTIDEGFFEDVLDFYKFLASPGDSAVIDLQGFDSGLGTLGDPTLSLYDNTGAELAFNDDFDFFSLDSRIEYDAFPCAGDYYIAAGSFGFSSGSYTLTTTLDTANPLVGIGGADTFHFSAREGEQIVIQTSTPLAGIGEPLNSLDPTIKLLDPQGVVVEHNNVVGNEILSHTAPTSGNYTIAVSAADRVGGEYVLSVTGNTQQHASFVVNNSSLQDGMTMQSAPTEITLDFSHHVLLNSLSASDLTVNDVAAKGLTLVNGDTVAFDIRELILQGANTIQIAAGSILDIRSTQNEAFEITLVFDSIPPRITALRTVLR